MQTVSSTQFDASNQDEAAIYAKLKRWVEMFSATGTRRTIYSRRL